MKVMNFGGFDYYEVYRIYVTEPCIFRTEFEIKPGCTQGRAKCAEPLDGYGSYETLQEAEQALSALKSTVQRHVKSSRGFYYNVIREYYVQHVITDDKGKAVNIDEDRVYSKNFVEIER